LIILPRASNDILLVPKRQIEMLNDFFLFKEMSFGIINRQIIFGGSPVSYLFSYLIHSLRDFTVPNNSPHSLHLNNPLKDT